MSFGFNGHRITDDPFQALAVPGEVPHNLFQVDRMFLTKTQ